VGKTCDYGAVGTGFKSQTEHIFHALPATRLRCKLEMWALAQTADLGTAHTCHPKGC